MRNFPGTHEQSVTSLNSYRDFRCLRSGRSAGAKHRGVRWIPRRYGQVRVGIVVSSKVGNAVTRNRVRRRLREALRALAREDARWPAGRGADLLVITRPEAADASYAQLKGSLERALLRAEFLQ